jgi:hypothetical protein
LSQEITASGALLDQGPLAVVHWYKRITDQSIIIRALKTKSLLVSPAYRKAGFTKGRNYPSLAKRGEGRFSET